MNLDARPAVRVVLGLALAVTLVGCADGQGPMVRRGGGGACGDVGDACCGAGFCNEGLACVSSLCMASSCGGEFLGCCAMGRPCGPGLMCVDDLCLGELPLDGGVPACGMRGEACCGSTPSCGVGLACIAGSCRDEGPCGATGQSCCAGETCESGNLCVDGACRSEVPIPMCAPRGGACAVSSDCCERSCSMGVCGTSTTPPPSPPSTDSCGSAFTCYDCTVRANCGFCDGACVFISDPDRAPCSTLEWTILECF